MLAMFFNKYDVSISPLKFFIPSPIRDGAVNLGCQSGADLGFPRGGGVVFKNL